MATTLITIICNIKASLINFFRKGSTVAATPKAVVPNFDDGNCKCEQVGLDFSGGKQFNPGRANMNKSIIAKDSKIKNLSQFLHNLGVSDEQIHEVADGTINDIDKNFLIFSHRK